MIKKENKTESYIVKRGKFASHNRTSKNKSFRSTMHRAGKVRLRASTFYRLTSQKNPKSKDVFDITGRVLCETAVKMWWYGWDRVKFWRLLGLSWRQIHHTPHSHFLAVGVKRCCHQKNLGIKRDRHSGTSVRTYMNFPVILFITRCIQIPDTLLPSLFESFVTTFPFLTRGTYIAFYAISSVTPGNSLGRGNTRYSRCSRGSWRTSRTLNRACYDAWIVTLLMEKSEKRIYM